MTDLFPTPPPPPGILPTTRPNAGTRTLLALRRSAGSKTLSDPGPSQEETNELLTVAARVPDHRRLEPWRFIVFEGEAREAFGETIAARHVELTPDASARDLEVERKRFLRAPVVIGVISSPTPEHKTPVWEQELSCGAVCYNLLLAANAAGWAGCWLTEWIAFDPVIATALDLVETERVAGFLYLGTAMADAPERPRPDIAEKTTRWTP